MLDEVVGGVTRRVVDPSPVQFTDTGPVPSSIEQMVASVDVVHWSVAWEPTLMAPPP